MFTRKLIMIATEANITPNTQLGLRKLPTSQTIALTVPSMTLCTLI